MMTTLEVAVTLGVAERSIYRAIKRTGMRWTLARQGGAYVFSNDDVLVLAHVLKARHLGYLVRTLTPNSYVCDASHAT